MTLARERQERGYQTYALRLLDEIASYSAPPNADQAVVHYRQALTLAEELGMRPLAAHCHLGLGTLYSWIGRREQARTELSTALTLLQSMGMTFWLPQVKAGLAAVCERKHLSHKYLNVGLEALSTCISHYPIAHLLSYEVSVLHQMALVKPQVRWRAVSAADLRAIMFDSRQLQRKFKHAVDFGVTGKYSRQQVTMLEQRYAHTLRMRRH